MPEWSRVEVEAIVDDYLAMLAAELAGIPYSKTTHRRKLHSLLVDRSEPSIEFKHGNISAILVEAGFPYIRGYKPRSNYQALLADVLAERFEREKLLLELAVADVDRPVVVPEVEDILAVLTEKPRRAGPETTEDALGRILNKLRLTTNYLEREARNRSLGDAGEAFILHYECARLIHLGKERLASRIEHTAKLRGDYEGYDILSFEESGQERLIEVKTTKYGDETPFYVSKNEVSVSDRESARYHVYRLFNFCQKPRLYTLAGAINASCILSPTTYLASPR
jgi:hypothetical protein